MNRRDRTNDPHHVYRCYDREGRLVYVGSTTDLFGRLKTHESQAWWAPQVVKVKAEAHPNGVVARKVESRAIREEVPRWNKQGKWAGRGIWTREDWHDWLHVLIREDRLSQQLENSIRDYRSMFREDIPSYLADMHTHLVARAEARKVKWDAEQVQREKERTARDTEELRSLNAELSALMRRQENLARALGIDWDDPELYEPEKAIDEALAAKAKERQR